MENFVVVPINDLKILLGEAVETKLREFLGDNSKQANTDNEGYATRIEVAKMLRISLPTLTQYTKDGILKGYRIGRRVLYKQNEVDSVLTEITTSKYKRKDHIK